jgi:hypothetical protein
MIKECEWCKKQFETKRSVILMCSDKCREENRNARYSGWSLKYDRCQKCGATDKPHECRGMCRRCYLQEDDQRKRGRAYYYRNIEYIRERGRQQRKNMTKEGKRKLADKMIKYKNATYFGGNWYKVKGRAGYRCEDCGVSEKDYLNEHGRILAVHHKDKNRLNNTMENLLCLCWECHAQYHKRCGEENKWSKLTGEQVKEIKKLKDKKHRLEVAERYNVNERTIRSIWSGINWKHIK